MLGIDLFPLLPLFKPYVEVEIKEEVGKGSIQGSILRHRLFTEVMDAACHRTANKAALHNRHVYQWSKKI